MLLASLENAIATQAGKVELSVQDAPDDLLDAGATRPRRATAGVQRPGGSLRLTSVLRPVQS